MHLIQCTGTSPVGKDCVAWTSIRLPKRIPKNFMDRPFVGGFCAAPVFEDCKAPPPSNNTNNTSLFCADSHEQHGRTRNIRIFEVQNNDEDVCDCVVNVATEIVVTISKQHISVCLRLPSRKPRSRPILEKFVRRETNFRVLTQKRNLKNSSKKTCFYDNVTLLNLINTNMITGATMAAP